MGIFNFFKKKEKDIFVLQQEMYEKVFKILSKVLPDSYKQCDVFVGFTNNSISVKYFVLNKDNVWEDCFKFYSLPELYNKVFKLIEKEVKIVRGKLMESQKWSILNLSLNNKGNIKATYDYADSVNKSDEDLEKYIFNKEQEWNKKYFL